MFFFTLSKKFEIYFTIFTVNYLFTEIYNDCVHLNKRERKK